MKHDNSLELQRFLFCFNPHGGSQPCLSLQAVSAEKAVQAWRFAQESALLVDTHLASALYC